MKTTHSPVMRLFIILAIFFSSIAAAPFSQSAIPEKRDTAQILEDLGGVPCSEWSSFTCITIEVPLNHFDPSDTRMIPVVFAVLPASGERKGMFVVATGGPGTSGVLLADSYVAEYDASIFESFDIVFFDQRGMGLSGGLTCPAAATEYYQKDGRGLTRKQEKALKRAASTFVDDCVDELSSTELLPYLGTRQAVEDLEVYRQIIGDKKFWLYGESYGTQFAQTYAAAHSKHLAGLILDGTVDLTYSGFEYYVQQAQAFNDTLVATLSACNDDPACAEQMKGDAIAVYDRLAAKLRRHPISVRFSLPNGRVQKRKFTLSDLEFVASSQLYTESDRMLFTRALAAYASNRDLVPLARLLYIDLAVDPLTLDIIPDDSWSDAVFYAVECQDYGYPGDTPKKRAENYLNAMDPFEKSIPRLASIIYGDLPCAYWPHASSDLTRPDYLVAEGIPTLVLGATADPATPYSHSVNVYEHLADGYLITTEGGPHVTFGYGNECPDALVTDFLVSDATPAERETVCEGAVADEFVPVAPRIARSFSDPAEAFSSVETEIYYLPEFFYWDVFTPTSVGCTYGGRFDFSLSNDGIKYLFNFKRCEFTKNFRMTGTGRYNTELDRFVLNIKTTGRWSCNVQYIRRGEKVTINGECNGKPLRAAYDVTDQAEHQVPDLNVPRKD
jgi:pimeloyl-ACP methyl ester carboxylesterase